MVEESDIFKKILIEEKDTLKELESQISRATEIFRIEKPSGKIIFQNFGELSDTQRISALLMGKFFAKKAGLEVNDSVGVGEISKGLGRPMTTLSGPLKELVNKGFVERLLDRKYRIAYHRISEILDKILKVK